MATISADKETWWEFTGGTKFGIVHFRKTTEVTDDEGNTTKSYWRVVITPDDDLDELGATLGVGGAVATGMRTICEIVQTPAAIARYEAQKAANEG